jgi:hypothetical protein
MAEVKDNRPTKPSSMTSIGGATETKIEQPATTEYKGRYRNKADGFIYKHAKKDHPIDRTHKFIVDPVFHDTEKNDDGTPKLLHTGLFWEGTKEEADKAFERL